MEGIRVRVAVIGAGAAGIASARRLQENGILYDVLEQSDSIGGTWVYDDRVGANQYGDPIHTSMYQNLRTNLPKEIMAFPDFPIPHPTKSYVPADVILQYLRDYADHYQVVPNIKFNTKVEEISPGDIGWVVTTKDHLTNKTKISIYDAIMVCNGHYHTPNIPRFPGIETFTGRAMHSHDYRRPDELSGLSVVVVGAGPSGLDIALDIAAAAKQVFVSHHLKDNIATQFPPNFIFKPDILNISGKKIQFVDETVVKADILLYCTGYVYNFPFIDDECGVRNEGNYVSPLYKHLISIYNPSLCFVGLPFYVCANAMFDLQVRFFIATLTGAFELPSEEEMLLDEKEDMKKRRALGFSRRESHKMGPLQGGYYDDLAKTANIPGIAPVMTKLHNKSSQRFLEDLRNFRADRFQIINQEEFIEL